MERNEKTILSAMFENENVHRSLGRLISATHFTKRTQTPGRSNLRRLRSYKIVEQPIKNECFGRVPEYSRIIDLADSVMI